MVKYFVLGLWWISRGRRKSDFSFSVGKKKRTGKTDEVLAIDTELPIVERFTVSPIVEELLPVFDLIFLLLLQVCVRVCVCVSKAHYKCYTPVSPPCSIFLPLIWTKCPKFNFPPYKLAGLSCQERKRPLSIAWKEPVCGWEGKVEVPL